MNFILLANRWDSSAAMIAVALRRHHPAANVCLVTWEELVFAPRWAHRVGGGTTVSRVELHDGRVLDSEDTDVVLNRLTPFDLPHFGEADRAYAVAEWSALLTSWLEGFRGVVINPVTPRSFSTAPSPLRAFAWAAEAGLPLPRVRLTSNLRRFPADGLKPATSFPLPLVSAGVRSPAILTNAPSAHVRSVLLAGDEICGELPSELIPACRAYARLAGTPVTTLSFTHAAESDSRWLFASANPLPELDDKQAEVVARFLAVAG